MKSSRHIYLAAGFQAGGMELLPGVAIEFETGEEPSVLLFTLPDGSEQLAFILTPDGKRALASALTGIEIVRPDPRDNGSPG